jgi:hypothetical protein
MLLVTNGVFGYPGTQCRAWMSHVGFGDSCAQPVVGPDSIVVGLK